MILASHPVMLLQRYGLPVIVALNRFGSDTERGFKMIRRHLGEQGVEALVCDDADECLTNSSHCVQTACCARVRARNRVRNATMLNSAPGPAARARANELLQQYAVIIKLALRTRYTRMADKNQL